MDKAKKKKNTLYFNQNKLIYTSSGNLEITGNRTATVKMNPEPRTTENEDYKDKQDNRHT